MSHLLVDYLKPTPRGHIGKHKRATYRRTCRPTAGFCVASLLPSPSAIPASVTSVVDVRFCSAAVAASATVILASFARFHLIFHPRFLSIFLSLLPPLPASSFGSSLCRLKSAGLSTLTAQDEPFPLYYRSSAPDPRPSVDSLTPHPFSPPPPSRLPLAGDQPPVARQNFARFYSPHHSPQLVILCRRWLHLSPPLD